MAHAIGDAYSKGADADADLVSRYLGDTAGGVSRATMAAIPSAYFPIGEEESAAKLAAKYANRPAEYKGRTFPDEPPNWHPIYPGRGSWNSTPGAIEREGEGVRRANPAYAYSVNKATDVGHATIGLPGYHPDAMVVDAHDPTDMQNVGRLIMEPGDGVMRGRDAFVPEAERGRGIGPNLLRKGVDYAHENGMDWGSDSNLSPRQYAVYQKLQQQGYPVEFHPEAAVSSHVFDETGDPHMVAPRGEPVAVIRKPTDPDTATPDELPQFDPNGSIIPIQAYAEGGEVGAGLGLIARMVERLKGLPATATIKGATVPVNPSPVIRQAAEAYKKAAGITTPAPTTYVRVNPDQGQLIAAAFDKMPHAPDDPKVQAAYQAMIKETLAQYQHAKAAGLKVDFIPPGSPDPYADSPRHAIHDIQQNNHMWVFPTDSGFGTGPESEALDHSKNPLLADSGETFGGVPAKNNDIFRVVHDYFGHAKEGNGFRADGEENAWRQHASMYSDLARPAMTTETRGQNNWVNWGPNAAQNKGASGIDTIYAPQKMGLLPDHLTQDTHENDDFSGLLDFDPSITTHIPRSGYSSVSITPAIKKDLVQQEVENFQNVDPSSMVRGQPELISQLQSGSKTITGDAVDYLLSQLDFHTMRHENATDPKSRALFQSYQKLQSKYPAQSSVLPTPDDLSFIHYGNPTANDVTLDPKFMGRGIKGQEARRGGPKVTSLYAEDNSAPEQGLESKTKYRVQLPADSLYDLSADPDGHIESNRQPSGAIDMAGVESDIKDAGHLGYHIPNPPPGAPDALRGQARVFQPVRATRVEPAPEGAGDEEDLSAGFARGGVVRRASGTPEGGELGAGLGIISRLAERIGQFPELAERYPEQAPGVLATDKATGKQFPQKQLTPEAMAVKAVRIAAQKDINAGNYDPYFPVAQRADVDPGQFPQTVDTLAITPKKAVTVQKYADMANAPDARARLLDAYQTGLPLEGSQNWYFMKQLADKYNGVYGDIGPAMFKSHFADAMAATTGGADPTSNLVMAHYGNYLKNQGLPAPDAAHAMPYPIGGRYASGNMDMYNKIMNNGVPMGDTNPKRVNFSANFQGHPDRATIDEQMSGLFNPEMAAPAPGTYGVYEQALHDLANEQGVDPRFFQEVAWAGAKKSSTPNYTPKPMIQIVNEAIERTHRITGMDQDAIVDGMVRGNIPLYGEGGSITVASSG
jgi:GNAT superfamily N-acetyltransferase